MEKLSRRLFFRVLPGVAAALGLAAKAKPAIVVDEPVSGVQIMARARQERTAIEQLWERGWRPSPWMNGEIGDTFRMRRLSWDSQESHALTLNSPAMVEEWNALGQKDWLESSREVLPQRLHEQDVTGQFEHLFNEARQLAFNAELDAMCRESQVEILQWLQPTSRLGLGLGDKERL